jgi:putative heme-binding domain-containing protein
MKRMHTIVLFVFVLVYGCQPNAEMSLPNVESILESSKIGLPLDDVRFSWQVSPDDKVRSYQILVANNRDLLNKEVADIWDSGRRFTLESSARYNGPALPAGKTVWWKAKFWNKANQASDYTKPESIEVPEKDTLQRIVLLGGTLIAELDKYPYLETSILQNWPTQSISLRNIGWPADDVFGLARSQFGSAQNTRSWQPPSAEDGFGSKVLLQHIVEAKPNTIIIGYGPEMAFIDDSTLFESGYKRLLNIVDSLGINAILLSPPRHEKSTFSQDLEIQKSRLNRTREFIKEQAEARRYLFIDLYEELVQDPAVPRYTENGVQLNAAGYRKFSDIILNHLGINATDSLGLVLDEMGQIDQVRGAIVTNWNRTVRGVRFDLKTQALNASATIDVSAPYALYIDGDFIKKGEEDFQVTIREDSLRYAQLVATILLKNKLHRYRLRPLNEAYIYLFRRHEMGHLAYEMDDFSQLVFEKEKEISRLLNSPVHSIEIELIRPWQPPKDYPEDEVPAFIPEPDPTQELRAFTVSDGFQVNLFAADPMIANPINLNWDTRGRAWVATSSTYPHIVPGREPSDQIVILEDTDHDGVADKHTVFADGLLVPHSVMPVPGGAYVTSTTEFLFLADTNGDDRADTRRVVFDGFGNADVHHMIHGLRWAPWGDLYFTQSIYINTFVETNYGMRQLNGSGIWQFRPETEKLEVFSRGLINPWGHAFDQWGQAFATDGAGSSGINFVFPESAHPTAVGAAKVLEGLNSGTPKNTGAEVLYSRHLPASWQGSIITNDFRANRTVRYEIQPSGSGYTSKEVETILHSDHRSYRPVDNKVGPDGALYIVDWYNPIIDHGEVDFHHPVRDKSHGRIWRITQKNKPVLSVPKIHGASISELLNLLCSPEQLTRLLANRELVAQGCALNEIKKWLNTQSKARPHFEQSRLEALWLEAALNYYDEELLGAVINSRTGQARAAGVRMLAHYQKQAEHLELLEKLVDDVDAQVRLETVLALRELGTLQAIEIAMQVLDHELDPNLEFATWFLAKELKDVWLPEMVAGKSLFTSDVNKQMFVLLASDDTLVVPLIVKLIADPALKQDYQSEAWQKLARLGDAKALSLVLAEAVERNKPELLVSLAKAPATNIAVPDNLSLLGQALQHDMVQFRQNAMNLVGRWKVKQFEEEVLQKAQDVGASMSEQITANKALVKLGRLNSVIDLIRSGGNQSVQAAAASVWAQEEPEKAANEVVELLGHLDSLPEAELLFTVYRQMETGPAILTKALAGKVISEPVASRGLRVAQSSGLNLSALEDAIRAAGSLAPVGAQMTSEERTTLLAEAMSSGASYRGRQIYRRPQLLCATCHRVDGIGGLIGPDLSRIGTYMTPNSILESILNPSSDIKQGYETVIATKTDGEVISGTLYRKTDVASLIRIASGEIVSVPNSELEKLDVSAVSLMPAGLTASLHRDELKDLISYLINLGMEK